MGRRERERESGGEFEENRARIDHSLGENCIKVFEICTFAAKSWSNDYAYVHVDVDKLPGDFQPPNQEAGIKVVAHSNNSRSSDSGPPSGPKIDVNWPSSLEHQAVSGEGIKDQEVTTSSKPRERTGGEGGEDEREGAEQPVVDHGDREVLVGQLTEAGVRI